MASERNDLKCRCVQLPKKQDFVPYGKIHKRYKGYGSVTSFTTQQGRYWPTYDIFERNKNITKKDRIRSRDFQGQVQG